MMAQLVAPFFLDVECSDDSAICVGPLDMNTTISQLKEEIADNIPVNLPIQKLSFNGVTLSDDTATLLGETRLCSYRTP